MKKILLKKNKGFIILFAMLISSIILLISSGIFNVVQKEVVLSSYARESQRAFYAADSALECALYADIVGFAGASTNSTPFLFSNPANSSFKCGNTDIDSSALGQSQNYEQTYAFRYRNADSLDVSCAYVLVEKELRGDTNADDDPNAIEVRITAVGFNVCTDGTIDEFTGILNIPDFQDPTLLERRLSLTYSR